MNKLNVFKAGSIAFALLGVLHLAAHFATQLAGAPADEQLTKLLADMQNYQVNLFGQHSLLQYHNGFSIMMGVMIFALGVQNFLLAETIVRNARTLWASMLVTLIALVIALLYFHALAYGFIAFSLVCYGLALFLKDQNRPAAI